MTTALDRTRALLDTPTPDPIPGQLHLEHDMTAVDLPAPIVVTRHQCPHCRRYTRADPARVEWHMARCLKSMAARNCGTCEHHQQESIDNGHYCIPGRRCGCNDWDEACTHPDGPEDDYRFPVQNCPLWQPAP